MPRLLLFAPCEKVIIDGQSNQVTVISLIQDVKIAAPSGASAIEIPQGSVAPFPWSVLTIWERESGDQNVRYEQSSILRSPTGETLSEAHPPTQLRFERPSVRCVEHFIG